MRMSTPLPVILYREALEGGVVIDGHHIPEGADIGIESYAIHHNEEYYPNSFKYDPERWIANEATGVSADSVYLAQSAFCPFSVGPRSCIGKAFAYKEMMLVMARLCFLFDMRLLPGSTLGEGGPELGWGRHRRHELQLEDSFVSKASGPLMQFRARLSTLT